MYRTVRKLVNTNAGVVALKATASDIVTTEPLKGVLFTLTSDGTVLTKRTAEKGSFHIRNMKPGAYEVVVKKDGSAGIRKACESSTYSFIKSLF
jgi:hypothetical protein